MKRLTLFLICMVMIGFGGFTMAKQPKATILHCECTYEGDSMAYTEIEVSHKSKGHANHTIGSLESCFDGIETYTDVVRTGDDCKLSGTGLDYLTLCADFTEIPVEGTVCGVATIE